MHNLKINENVLHSLVLPSSMWHLPSQLIQQKLASSHTSDIRLYKDKAHSTILQQNTWFTFFKNNKSYK